MSVVSSLERVADKLKEAQQINRELQAKEKVGSPKWLEHDKIDDRLHEAVAALNQ